MVTMPRTKRTTADRPVVSGRSTTVKAVTGRAAISRTLSSRSRRRRSTALQRSADSRRSVANRKPIVMRELHGTISVIISARNEERTLGHLLKQVSYLKPAEIIVVLNGCSDNSYQVSRRHPQAMIVHCAESVGHDVGRAIGAKLSRGNILLFLDGDMVIPASQLVSFAMAVDDGIDVALNDLNPLLPSFGLSDDVTRTKLFLNYTLGRPDLGVSSMTAVPHALSRRALETIGYRQLMVPPRAQAISILEKLRVEKVKTVDVIKHNRIRRANTGAGNAIEKLIIGDHAEAMFEILSRRAADGTMNSETLRESRRQVAAWRNRL